jgi:hypothetical protein
MVSSLHYDPLFVVPWYFFMVLIFFEQNFYFQNVPFLGRSTWTFSFLDTAAVQSSTAPTAVATITTPGGTTVGVRRACDCRLHFFGINGETVKPSPLESVQFGKANKRLLQKLGKPKVRGLPHVQN